MLTSVILTIAYIPVLMQSPIGGTTQKFILADDKLAPYLPSPQAVVERMLEMAQIKPDETVYDLGCGDGRIVITAAQKYNARAVGIEIDDLIFNRTRKRVTDLGLDNRVQIVHGSALETDLAPADVVTLYLLTSANKRLKPQLARLKPGARVVSYSFEIPDWKSTRVETMQVDRMNHVIYLYEIPKKK